MWETYLIVYSRPCVVFVTPASGPIVVMAACPILSVPSCDVCIQQSYQIYIPVKVSLSFSHPKVSKIQNRYKEHSNKKKLENRPPQKWPFWF